MCNCGRKQKNIFLVDNQELIKVNKLALPAVHGVMAKKTPQGTLLTWFGLTIPTTPTVATPYLCDKFFIGYNIYRLVRTNIIPKKPINHKPIRQTIYLDRAIQKNNKPYYIVRAVFLYNNTVTEGPTSLIIRLTD